MGTYDTTTRADALGNATRELMKPMKMRSTPAELRPSFVFHIAEDSTCVAEAQIPRCRAVAHSYSAPIPDVGRVLDKARAKEILAHYGSTVRSW